jgi:hypothetical protein
VVALLGVVVVHQRQASAQRDDVDEISRAFQRADCAAARTALDSARTRPMIYGDRAPVPDGALDQVAQCGELDAAAALAADGRAEDAVAAYVRYLREHPGTPLARVVPNRLGTVLREEEPQAGTGVCRDLAAVVAAGDLAPDVSFPRLFTDCGVKLAGGDRAADREGARTLLTEVRTAYPASSQRERAVTAEARARVALSPRDGTMTSPYRVSGPSKGALVKYVNHTPWPAVLAMSGADDGRVIELTACPTCELYEEGSNGPADCESDGAQAVTIELPPGTYRVAIQYEGENTPPANSGRWTLSKGRYAECYYALE